MNKFYFLSDWNILGYNKFKRQRDPDAYAEIFPWYFITYDNVSEILNQDSNILFIKTPAFDELKKLKIIKNICDNTNTRIFIIQESTIFDWFDWSAEEQKLYIEILSKSEAFLYHNESDKEIMKLFINNFIKYKPCIGLFIDKPRIFDQGEYIFLPNPVKRFQRGMISHKIANDINTNIPIISMEYNKPINLQLSFPDNYNLDKINLTQKMSEQEWLAFIYNSKFGIDIHREYSAGNCVLEFGSLGVPLIGNILLDPQRDIFPDLSFDYKDYENIKKSIILLANDKDFYEEVSAKALKNTQELYNSTKIVEDFRKEISKFI